jgi:hypothetical protein
MAARLVDHAKTFETELKDLRKAIKAETVNQIGKQGLRHRAEELGSEWFSELAPQLQTTSVIDEKKISEYGELFQDLIALSGPSNLRSRYLAVLTNCVHDFRKDFILPLQTISATPASQLLKLLSGVKSPVHSDYLQEAIACASQGYFRAAAVLGWCAAIDQIHHTIEKIGFAKFNVASSMIASQTKGRFKKFNQVQNVSSISELREVFDNIILWILEGMQLVDINQHTRLHSCFELRCQCSHPGEAPITEYNLLSFFSDLNEIVFKNAKLSP